MRRILAAALGCLLIFTAGWAADVDVARIAPSAPPLSSDLPDLGGPATAMISKFDDEQIGRMEMNQLRDLDMILEDPEVTDYLQQLGSRLAAQSGVENQTFTYLALREPIVNAFATFGGFICINTGLILLTNDEGQLASVMAHETGHVVQRHMARMVQAESRMSLASLAGLLAAVLIAAASGAGGQGMEGAVAMSQAIAMQQGAVARPELEAHLLICHAWHQPQRHAASAQLGYAIAGPHIGDIMTSVGELRLAADWIKHESQAGDEHMRRNVGTEQVINMTQDGAR